jgi:ABC-type Na+ efflux pump permease subunit
VTRDLTALGWSTVDLVRRLMREKHVVRSLLWPIALVPITLMFTVFGFVWLEGDWPVGVQAGADPSVATALRDAGFTPVEVADARSAVLNGTTRTATDGQTVWAASMRGRALQIERALRVRAGADWMVARARPPVADQSQGSRVMGVIGVLFVLFGVVFGAGMVARDRDDGTLEAELALGVRRWVHGAARWVAGSVVLLAHYALAVLVLHAILGVEGAWQVARHGIAACAGSVAVGLLVVGRAGLKAGFSGPLASGLALASGLVAVGLVAPAVGGWLPIASMLAGGDGFAPLVGALALGAAAIAVFTRRSASA